MQVERSADFLDDVSGKLMEEAGSVELDRSGYVSGRDLMDADLPNESKTQYYCNQTGDRGTTEQVRSYLDPLGYRVHLSRTKSALLGTTADADVYFVDLSILQLLVNGNPLGSVPGDHTYEVFVTGDAGFKSKLVEYAREAIAESEDA